MYEQYKKAFGIILAIGVVLSIIAFNHGRIDDELIGAWKLESLQSNGSPQSRERQLWVFRQGTLTIVFDDDIHDARITVDPTAVPKILDTDLFFQSTGIYEIDGDTLRVSQVVKHEPRPTEFKTTWGDMRTISVLRRVRADPWISDAELHDILLSEFGPATDYPDRIEFDEEAEEFVSNLMREIYDKSGEKTPREAVVYHISWLMTEVNNGGFHQFFYNSTGDHALETVALLRDIGAPQTAALVENGCKLFPQETPSKDRRERHAQLDRFTLDHVETLHDLDERFYSRREDLNLLLKKYWERKP